MLTCDSVACLRAGSQVRSDSSRVSAPLEPAHLPAPLGQAPVLGRVGPAKQEHTGPCDPHRQTLSHRWSDDQSEKEG